MLDDCHSPSFWPVFNAIILSSVYSHRTGRIQLKKVYRGNMRDSMCSLLGSEMMMLHVIRTIY